MTDPVQEHDPWITLALAVVYQAMLDAQNGHPSLAVEAKLWLRHTGVSWGQILDIPRNVLNDWVDNDFRLSDRSRRNWRY